MSGEEKRDAAGTNLQPKIAACNSTVDMQSDESRRTERDYSKLSVPHHRDAPRIRGDEQHLLTASHRTASHPPVAWLFDIDGVLTSPELKIIAQPTIYHELIRRLQAGQPIGFNTGRSLQFVVERVLAPLEDHLRDKALLSSVIAVGEKGATWLTYQNDGTRVESIDSEVGIPRKLQEVVRDLIQQPEFSTSMFYDETKRTMISVELRDGHSLVEFAAAQTKLVTQLHHLLARYALEDQLKIDPTTIATDVERIGVGKGLGAARFLHLLERMRIQPDMYVCFGDSQSDYEMFEELGKQGKKTEFVFVGGRERLKEKDSGTITFTRQLYDAGTVDYLTRC